MSTAVTTTFSANTKIKSAEVNQNFIDVFPSNQTITAANVWQAASVNPVINNGTLTAYWSQHGKIVHLAVYMIAGDTTTFGSGTWKFILPVTAVATGFSCPIFVDRLGAGGQRSEILSNTSTTFATAEIITAGGAASYYDATHPFSWGNVDSFWFNLFYLAA